MAVISVKGCRMRHVTCFASCILAYLIHILKTVPRNQIPVPEKRFTLLFSVFPFREIMVQKKTSGPKITSVIRSILCQTPLMG